VGGGRRWGTGAMCGRLCGVGEELFGRLGVWGIFSSKEVPGKKGGPGRGENRALSGQVFQGGRDVKEAN